MKVLIHKPVIKTLAFFMVINFLNNHQCWATRIKNHATNHYITINSKMHICLTPSIENATHFVITTIAPSKEKNLSLITISTLNNHFLGHIGTDLCFLYRQPRATEHPPFLLTQNIAWRYETTSRLLTPVGSDDRLFLTLNDANIMLGSIGEKAPLCSECELTSYLLKSEDFAQWIFED